MTGTDSADPGRAEAGASRFDAAFEAHYLRILAFAIRRMESRVDAEDVAAETFAVAWRRRNTLPDTPLPWLYAVALRIIANDRRSAHRRSRRDERLAHEPAPSGRDPAEIVGSRD